MSIRKKTLHFMCDEQQSVSVFAALAKRLQRYVDYFHIRLPKGTLEQFTSYVEALLDVGIPREQIFVHERMDVVRTYRLGGVQLKEAGPSVAQAKKILPNSQIGKSIHHLENGHEEIAPTWYVYGNIWETTCKPDKKGVGATQLQKYKSMLNARVVIIGGICPEKLRTFPQDLYDGVIVRSLFYEVTNPELVAEELIKVMQVGGEKTCEKLQL